MKQYRSSYAARSTSAARRGFTLVEVLVGLTLASLVVLLAQRVLSAVADATHRAAAAARTADERRNAERWLAEALGSIEVGLLGDVPFAGSPSQLTCTTFLRAAGGWREQRTITLRLVDRHFVVQVNEDSLVLATEVDALAIDYLLEPGLRSVWATSWQSPVSAPLAIRIRLDRSRGMPSADTLLFVVGARG